MGDDSHEALSSDQVEFEEYLKNLRSKWPYSKDELLQILDDKTDSISHLQAVIRELRQSEGESYG
jgi:hypothetical protein